MLQGGVVCIASWLFFSNTHVRLGSSLHAAYRCPLLQAQHDSSTRPHTSCCGTLLKGVGRMLDSFLFYFYFSFSFSCCPSVRLFLSPGLSIMFVSSDSMDRAVPVPFALALQVRGVASGKLKIKGVYIRSARQASTQDMIAQLSALTSALKVRPFWTEAPFW